jgi:hypothetical protein
LKIIHREIGASEAGIALSVVTVILVTVGYVALQLVSGGRDIPVVETGEGPKQVIGGEKQASKQVQEQLPQVLPAQGSSEDDVPLVSQRPVWEPRPLGEFEQEVGSNDSDMRLPGSWILPAR